jgi:hypothetical protein
MIDPETKYFRWAYALLVALAKRNLADRNATREAPNNWPCGMSWHELVGSSRSIFLRQAREEAGIPHQEFLDVVRRGEIDVEDIYDA